MSIYRVPYESQDYIYDGRRWFNAKTHIEPPITVVRALELRIREQRGSDDAAIRDFQPLLDAAQAARNNEELSRAEDFVRRALKLIPGSLPGSHGALTILCAVLRARKRPEQAVAEIEPFLVPWYEPLLTTYAAALCDLERWEDAKRVLEMWQGPQRMEMQMVIQKIRRNRQDLYGVE